MKSKVVLFVFVFFLFGCSKPDSSKELDLVFDYDFSGVDLFFFIADSLQQNVTVSNDTWNKLFETDGYKSLRNDQGIRNNLLLVFKPEHKGKLDTALLEAGYWWKRDLEHLIKVKENLRELKSFRDSIDIQSVLKKGRKLALEYMPSYLDTLNDNAPIRFVIFSPDARVMGGKIIFDLFFIKELSNNELAELIGHEFHHHYLSFVKNRQEGIERDDPNYPLYRPIRQLQIEGIADLINKKGYVKKAAEDDRWANAYHASNEKLAFMNERLEWLAQGHDSLDVYGEAIFANFPINCHPNGFFMAEVIENQLGKSGVIETLMNPFDFFRAYQEAAIKDEEAFVFSEEAMEYLKSFEEIVHN